MPLALAMSTYPNNLLLPPAMLGLTPQRMIAVVLMIRCLTTPAVRKKFKWGLVDTAAVIYFAMMVLAV